MALVGAPNYRALLGPCCLYRERCAKGTLQVYTDVPQMTSGLSKSFSHECRHHKRQRSRNQ